MSPLRNYSAFTLIELVVSLAITAVIAAFLFSFSSSLADIWRRSQSDVDTDLDVNFVLDQMARDLESAIMLEGNDPMFALAVIAKGGETLETGEVDAGPSAYLDQWKGVSARPATLHFDPQNHHYGWAGVWLRFFSSQPSVNAVSYQIVRRPAFSGAKVSPYLLNRAVVRHDHTFAAGYDITDSAYHDGSVNSELVSANIARPNLKLAILSNVVDFGVRLYAFDASETEQTAFTPVGLRMLFPGVLGTGANQTLDLSMRSYVTSTWSGVTPYPDVVEIFLRVLSQRGADLLYRLETDGEGEMSYEEIIEDHSKVYRRMVRIRAPRE